jgi:hypothetical protein
VEKLEKMTDDNLEFEHDVSEVDQSNTEEEQ